jgi:GNAT superfamily N-acetyltransferase
MIKYQLEKFDDYYADTQELWKKHFDEISINKHKRKLDPDLDNYRKLDKADKLAVYTARDDGKLIGYTVAVIARPLHYNHKAAMFDMYYVLPEYRKGHIGINLLKGFEEELKKKGVVEVHGGTKTHKDISKVFEHLGWSKTEIRFVKWIGE